MTETVFKSETPRVKEIFDLHVVQEKTVTQIAEILSTSHQAVSRVAQSDAFKSLERQYYETLEAELSSKQRTKLMKARALLYDAAEDVTRNLIAAAKDMNPAVRSAAITAQKAILSSIGLDTQESTGNSNKVLVINFSPDVVAKLSESGYTLPPTLEVKDMSHAAQLGKVMGEGIKKAGELIESTDCQPDAQANRSLPGGGVG